MSHSKTATSSTAYIQEELSSARLSVDKLKNLIVNSINLINASSKKDHFYGVAGDIILEAPKALLELERSLNIAAMAVSKLDYESIRNTLNPDKVEELERVLEDVRIRMPRKRAR